MNDTVKCDYKTKERTKIQGNVRNCFDCFDRKMVILCGCESEIPAKHNKTTEEDDRNGNN